MKNHHLLILVIFLSASLIGCGSRATAAVSDNFTAGPYDFVMSENLYNLFLLQDGRISVLERQEGRSDYVPIEHIELSSTAPENAAIRGVRIAPLYSGYYFGILSYSGDRGDMPGPALDLTIIFDAEDNQVYQVEAEYPNLAVVENGIWELISNCPDIDRAALIQSPVDFGPGMSLICSQSKIVAGANWALAFDKLRRPHIFSSNQTLTQELREVSQDARDATISSDGSQLVLFRPRRAEFVYFRLSDNHKFAASVTDVGEIGSPQSPMRADWGLVRHFDSHWLAYYLDPEGETWAGSHIPRGGEADTVHIRPAGQLGWVGCVISPESISVYRLE